MTHNTYCTPYVHGGIRNMYLQHHDTRILTHLKTTVEREENYSSSLLRRKEGVNRLSTSGVLEVERDSQSG
jgi:hypothetical protein